MSTTLFSSCSNSSNRAPWRCRPARTCLAAFVLILLSPPTPAASFDCDKAAIATEHKICANEELSRLDSKLASYYAQARRTTHDPAALKNEQLHWLAERDACGGDTDCIETHYRQRIATFLERLPHASAGARYRLVLERPPIARTDQGKLKTYDELCESVVAALNRMDPVRPMTCGIEFPPAVSDVSSPRWEPIDPKGHIALLKEIVYARVDNLEPVEQDRKWARARQFINSGRARLWRAKFDLNNEPGKETALRHDLRGCDTPEDAAYGGGWDTGIAVLDASGKHINDEAYWRLHQHPYYQPFFYAGRTWLWRWWGSFDDVEAAVYQPVFALDEFGWFSKSSCEIDYVE